MSCEGPDPRTPKEMLLSQQVLTGTTLYNRELEEETAAAAPDGRRWRRRFLARTPAALPSTLDAPLRRKPNLREVPTFSTNRRGRRPGVGIHLGMQTKLGGGMTLHLTLLL